MMSETLEPMHGYHRGSQQFANQLLAQAKEQGVELIGPDGLLNQVTQERETRSSRAR
jgi:hypothetical protein